MKNRDSRGNGKRAERQIATAGKLPFHRVAKLEKLFRKLPYSPFLRNRTENNNRTV